MKRRRALWWTCGVLAAVGLVTVIGGIIWVVTFAYQAVDDLGQAARSLPGEIAAARRERIPLESSDLKRVPPVPASRNASPYVNEIGRLQEAWSKAGPRVGDVMSAMRRPERTDADRQAARALLAQRKDMLDLGEQAARMPDCDLGKRYELGPNVQFRECAGVREVARLLAIRAVLSADAGRFEAAYADIARGMRLGRHAGREPVLITMLVRIAVEAIMDAAFTQITLEHADDPDALRFAQRALPMCGPLPDYAYACRGEIVINRACVALIRSNGDLEAVVGEPTPARVKRRLGDVRVRGLMCDAWDARIIAYWRRTFAALRAHPGDNIARQAALREADAWAQQGPRKISYLLLSIVSPVYAGAGEKILRLQAVRRLREGMLRVVAYRLRSRSWPATLDDAGGPPLIDPFSSKPLLYRRTPEGFVLYSVGEDRKDDGGIGVRPANDKPAPDIVVEYPRRPAGPTPAG